MEGTTEQDVDTLLNGFWQYYLAEDKQLDAYSALNLESGAEWAVVQSTYRALVAEHHPDRGGNATEFMAIREAYEILQKTLTVS
jgi:DnaJ-class molecular chaperone